MFWHFGDIMTTLSRKRIKMQVQKELKYSKFAWMKTVKDHTDAIPEDLLSCFRVLKKCKNKFNCLVNEILYIKQLTPSLPHHIIPTNWRPYWIINKIRVWRKNNNYISCKYRTGHDQFRMVVVVVDCCHWLCPTHHFPNPSMLSSLDECSSGELSPSYSSSPLFLSKSESGSANISFRTSSGEYTRPRGWDAILFSQRKL